ncbi:unnamed protein product [Bacillus phage SPP1]|uniref:Bacteriophage SPP1 complete nucleotide sequence n=1 Tax=Bacillus phage SPP1 TaxID=10724 RepID=O48439_BPSPP|nr:hypothetical protein SPP1p012 [Bacillus phage SPP1]CAA66582.1 unnamed protein product [Bacillus phage SPP1]
MHVTGGLTYPTVDGFKVFVHVDDLAIQFSVSCSGPGIKSGGPHLLHVHFLGGLFCTRHTSSNLNPVPFCPGRQAGFS